jgi:hypothetical protein
LKLKLGFPKIPQRKIIADRAEIILEYPETNIKEKLTISLKEPIALQAEEINRLVHRHLLNPQNPYRFFLILNFIEIKMIAPTFSLIKVKEIRNDAYILENGGLRVFCKLMVLIFPFI